MKKYFFITALLIGCSQGQIGDAPKPTTNVPPSIHWVPPLSFRDGGIFGDDGDDWFWTRPDAGMDGGHPNQIDSGPIVIEPRDTGVPEFIDAGGINPVEVDAGSEMPDAGPCVCDRHKRCHIFHGNGLGHRCGHPWLYH